LGGCAELSDDPFESAREIEIENSSRFRVHPKSMDTPGGDIDKCAALGCLAHITGNQSDFAIEDVKDLVLFMRVWRRTRPAGTEFLHQRIGSPSLFFGGQDTRGQFRTIGIHTCDAARQKAYEVAKTPEFAVALRKRRKVEALFSELKNLIGLRRLRLRKIKFVREQFYLAAVAQNLKRLVRFLNRRAQPAMATA
jgi:hypothetical protein